MIFSRLQVVIRAFTAKDGFIHSDIREVTFTVGAADEDFSIGVGASRVKFSARNEL